MPEYTNNYNLIKPKKSENYDIEEVTSKNMDIIDTQLFNKQQKEPGKGLSTNDFTDQYKNKLNGLKNYNDVDIKNRLSNVEKKFLSNEEDIKKINSVLQNFSEEQETQNNDISELQERVQLLENNQIKGTSEKGESVTITDAAKAYGELKVEGNTKQNGTPTPQTPIEIKNCKDSINIRVQNKNHVVLDEDAFKFGNALGKYAKINEDKTITTTSNFSNSRDKGTEMYLKKNTEYEVSVYVNSIVTDSNVKNVQLEILAYDASNKFIIPLSKTISETGKLTTYTFNSQDYKRVGVCVSGWFGPGQSGATTYSQLMVREKNTTDNTYVEGAYKKIVFPLKSGQVLRKGDYLADDGVHHTREGRTVNGTESNWTYYSANADWARPYFQITNKKTGEDDNTANVVCNKMKSVSWEEGRNASINTYGVFSYSGDKRICFLVKKEELETQDTEGVKKYFQANNMEIEYNLSEETIEEYTEEQQNVYNELKNLLYYQGYNYISSQDETSPIMQAFYIVDMNTKLASISSRLTNIESSTEVAQ